MCTPRIDSKRTNMMLHLQIKLGEAGGSLVTDRLHFLSVMIVRSDSLTQVMCLFDKGLYPLIVRDLCCIFFLQNSWQWMMEKCQRE